MEDEEELIMIEHTEENYFDTCTVIDRIDDHSQYHSNVTRAINQIKGRLVFSEYMENELKSVLRHAQRFSQRKDNLLSNYDSLKRTLNIVWVATTPQISNLHNVCRRISRRIGGLKFQDMVHIGICGLERIINIISDDRHIYGNINIVRQELSHFYPGISDPRHVYTTRQGYLRRMV